MILARGEIGGDQLLLIGLSKINVQRLLDGKPIHIHKSVHGEGVPDGWQIILTAGETEESLSEELLAIIDKPPTMIIHSEKLGRSSDT